MDSLKKIIKNRFAPLYFFYKYLGHRVFLVLLLSLLVSFLDGLGLTMFLPLLKIADGNTENMRESLGELAFIVDGFSSIGIPLTLLSVLCLMFFFFILKGIASFYSNYYKVIVKQYFVRQLRIKLINYLSNFSYKQFVSSDAGRIQNALTGEVGRVSTAFTTYFAMIQALVMVMVYMTFAFMADWKFALLICAGGILTNLVFRRIYKHTKLLSSQVTVLSNTNQGLLIQFVQNFKYLKATGSIYKYANKLKHVVKEVEHKNKRMSVLGIRISAIREPMLVGIVCIVILIQVYVLYGSLGTVLVSLLFFYRSLTSLTAIQSNYNNFLSVSASLENINDFENELKAGKDLNGKRDLKSFNQGISLKNVTFSYGMNDILSSVSLTIPKNSTVAFVGESGSGKTTIINIIAGLLPVTKGEVFIDDILLNELKLQSYQNHIGYITQEPAIFKDTIFNNVTFWDSKTPENVVQFQRALEQASIYDFVHSLPDMSETILGIGGLNLSGGQRQRISIARELYKSANILILDEATSALDSQTEREIQENIEQLKGHYTVLVVAHRLSTIKNADIIVLLDKGKIMDSGSFEDMLKKNVRFKAMVELQTF